MRDQSKVKVRPDVRAEAKRIAKQIAKGDESRLEELADGSVLVHNQSVPKRKKAPRP